MNAINFFTKGWVTVYITNYNYSDYIEQAIKSVLSQTYKSIRLIVIDDGSNDDSVKVIEALRDKYNFEFIQQPNLGLNKTNNIALKAANSEFIMRLDADDWLENDCIELLVNAINKSYEYALAFPDYFEVDECGRFIKKVQRFNFESEVSLLNEPAHGACTLFRVSALTEVGGYDESFDRQDGVDIWLKLVTKYRVTNVNKPLFSYRLHNLNLTKNEESLFRTRTKIFERRVRETFGHPLCMVVVPVLGRSFYEDCLALEELCAGYTVLDFVLERAFSAKTADLIIVTSPDKSVQKYIEKKHKKSKLTFVYRRPEISAPHSSLMPTLELCMEKIGSYENIVIFSPEYPFCNSFYIDLANYNQKFFSLDSVDTVIEDDSIFYYSTGKGIEPRHGETWIKRERDAVFRRAGGITLTSVEYMRENKKNLGGTMGHIRIDQKSSFRVKIKDELIMAKALVKEGFYELRANY